MSWSLFIDEAVDKHGDSPYKVVAGLAIEDKHIWPLTIKLNDANLHYFGRQLRAPNSAYLKAGDLLSRDIFKEAQTELMVSNAERIRLIHDALSNNDSQTNDQKTALAQAKILYCRFIINLIRDYEVRAFAVMAPSHMDTSQVSTNLRRDYSHLLERFFYFVDDQTSPQVGYLILSDLNKYTVTANSISDYFLKTKIGKLRSKCILPEPLFARGRVNVFFQAASLLAYALSWNFQIRTRRFQRSFSGDAISPHIERRKEGLELQIRFRSRICLNALPDS